jgi:hypothetical protein
MAIHENDEYVLGLIDSFASRLDPADAAAVRRATRGVRETLAQEANAVSPRAHELCGSRCVGGDPATAGDEGVMLPQSTDDYDARMTTMHPNDLVPRGQQYLSASVLRDTI